MRGKAHFRFATPDGIPSMIPVRRFRLLSASGRF
jgi:hypothetical protein